MLLPPPNRTNPSPSPLKPVSAAACHVTNHLLCFLTKWVVGLTLLQDRLEVLVDEDDSRSSS